MPRDQIVSYVERFAASFNPPCRNGVEVRRVSASGNGGRFALDTSDREITTDNLIVATGPFQQPNIAAWAATLADDIVQIHSAEYRDSAQLPDGAVLVVGSGQSGCQIVEDLRIADREVHLCVGKKGRFPRRHPCYERGVSEASGLYLIGLHWLYTLNTGTFGQVGRDAEFVVEWIIQNV